MLEDLCITTCRVLDKKELTSVLSKLKRIRGKTSISDPKIFNTLPNIICNFAKQARASAVYRFLARAVRHGSDPLCLYLLITKGNVIEYNNQI